MGIPIILLVYFLLNIVQKMFKTILLFLPKFSFICYVGLQWLHSFTTIQLHVGLVLLSRIHFKLFHTDFRFVFYVNPKI